VEKIPISLGLILTNASSHPSAAAWSRRSSGGRRRARRSTTARGGGRRGAPHRPSARRSRSTVHRRCGRGGGAVPSLP
jgi:hypothetical protein